MGNPGTEYEHTRHNVGFDVLERTAAFFQLKLRKRCFRLYREACGSCGENRFNLVQPLTFMNHSGAIVRYFSQFDVSSIIVICDNLDLPAGQIRIRQGGSSAGHNGLKSLIAELGSSDFIRIYVGIGRPDASHTVVEHVLQRPDDEIGRMELEAGVEKGAQALQALLSGMPLQEAMIAFNRKASSN